MAPRKPKPVKVVETHPFKQVAEIFLCPKRLDFYSEVLGEMLRAPSVDRLEIMIRARFDTAARLDWFPVITVRRVEPFGGIPERASWIGFVHIRFWLARGTNGQYLESGWDTETDAERTELAQTWSHDSRELVLPRHEEGRYGNETHLAYTPELWAALEGLHARVDAARAMFENLITTPEGHARLTAAGGDALRLLGSGDPTPPREDPA
jgi:hypothetical protein